MYTHPLDTNEMIFVDRLEFQWRSWNKNKYLARNNYPQTTGAPYTNMNERLVQA